MVIIAFAPKSSKILPNILCRNFKHCAVLVPHDKDFLLYQFVARGHTDILKIKSRDIGLLSANGWRFVYVPQNLPRAFPIKTWTCVGLAKYAIRVHAPFIQTPDELYRYIRN